MKTVGINISEYLDEDEIKDIVRSEFISIVRTKINSDAERLLSNFSHFQAQKIVDELLTEQQKEEIRLKTDAILKNFSSSTVFYKSWWHREPDSVAQQILNQTVESNREAIIQRVVGIISSYDYEAKLEENAAEIIKDAIIKKLSHKCEQ